MTDEDFIKMFGCDRDTYDKKLCENEYRILKERDNIAEEFEQMEANDINVLQNEHCVSKEETQTNEQIIVIAYFNYDTGRSDIREFTDEKSGMEWLLENWGFVLNGEEFSNLDDLMYILRNEYCVKTEMLVIKK